ncbi:hypothetical protein VC83_00100 [Pseudogymnoascus destructans]|uniref:Uncharacterized protein n=1 Tax=Pseudogymnoascus destructans TaxID=655981 RepID=A0A177ALY5_9PEZI|nr:uncharacterized protein VC83_00100 [Pseudogymnoascus destructans]OAF63077.1 hypothetical protein VC83_00100 [Pseudogymnoascus destructans]
MTAGSSSGEHELKRQEVPAMPISICLAEVQAQALSPGVHDAATMAEERQAVAQSGIAWAWMRTGRRGTDSTESFILTGVRLLVVMSDGEFNYQRRYRLEE